MTTTIDGTRFLRAHFEWCARQIHLEVRNEFKDLLWTRDDLATLAVEFLSEHGSPSGERFFVQRLSQSLRARYSTYVVGEWMVPGNATEESGDFEEFVARRLSVSSEGAWRKRYPGEKKTQEVIRAIRAQSPLELSDEPGVGFVASERLGKWFVRTYFAPDRRGFSYWHDLAESPEGRAIFRESFRSWFGLGLETRFQSFEYYGPREVAGFVLRKVERYRNFILGIAVESE